MSSPQCVEQHHEVSRATFNLISWNGFWAKLRFSINAVHIPPNLTVYIRTVSSLTDYKYTIRAFFLNFTKCLANWADRPNKFWGILARVSAQILSLCIPSLGLGIYKIYMYSGTFIFFLAASVWGRKQVHCACLLCLNCP